MAPCVTRGRLRAISLVELIQCRAQGRSEVCLRGRNSGSHTARLRANTDPVDLHEPTARPPKARAQPVGRLLAIYGTIVHADEGSGWDALHGFYETKRINHSIAYSLDGARTNQAESLFSRLRRAEIGTHHHFAGPYLAAYAGEMTWREDNRRAGERLPAAPSDARAGAIRGWLRRPATVADAGGVIVGGARLGKWVRSVG
jgi:hypothetical protein